MLLQSDTLPLCHLRTTVWVVLTLTLLTGSAATAQQDAHPDKLLVYVRDLTASAQMAARPTEALVYDAQSFGMDGRFQLNAGSHTFCLNGGGGVYNGIRITSSSGELLVPRLNNIGCGTVTLSAGVTTVRLMKLGARRIPASTTATVRVDPLLSASSAIPLTGASGNPINGYWAIQDATVNAPGTFGNRVITQPPQPANANPPAQMLLSSNLSFDNLSLFQLPDGTGTQNPALLAPLPNAWSIFVVQLYVASSCGGFFNYCENAYGTGQTGDPPGVQIGDQGNYQFVFRLNPTPGGLVGNLYADSSNGQTVLNSTYQAGDTFQVLFRFFPDGTTIQSLQPGEVALYQGCGQQGKAAVFIPSLGGGVVSPPYNLTALSSSVTTLDGTAKSIAVGSGASVYWGSSSLDIQGAVVSNTSCLNSSPSGRIFVEPLINTLTVAHDKLGQSCVNCSLKGQTFTPAADSETANFSHWNLSGADFSNAIISNLNLSGATLTGAKFKGATLSNINLDGAQLGGTARDFTGATLTNVTFSGVDVTNFNFSGATLNNVNLSSSQVIGGTGLNFSGATLNQVDLSGLNAANYPFGKAMLCGVSLMGSQDQVLDLTTGNFAGVQVKLSSDCAANLSYTIFTPAPNPSKQWNGLNLTGAVLSGIQGAILSTKDSPLQLSGAILTGTSLEGVVLDYAQGLAGQDLTQTNLNGSSLRFTNLQNIRLYGANLTNANLEGANMNGALLTRTPSGSVGAAKLIGAFLRNVNLSQSRLSEADFTNANFYSQGAVGTSTCTLDSNGFTQGCATAAGALMDATNFGGAYLFGVDFTGSNGIGVNFNNSILTGANFAGASVSQASGSNSGFSGTFLQGTNMASMNLGLTDQVSFNNAFVDFNPDGNTINLLLDGAHTTFAGYWGKAGEPVCAQMNYGSPTTIPSTNNLTTCPNGNQYPNGCGLATADGSNKNWASIIDITQEATYEDPATYTPASSQQICSFDPLWIPLNLAEPPGKPHPPKPHPPKPHPPKPHPPKPPKPRKPPKPPVPQRFP